MKQGMAVAGLGLLLIGCALQVTRSPTAAPAPTALPTTSAADWEALAPGMERRTYQPDNNALAQLVVIRLDPAEYTFRVHYRPGEPFTTFAWRDSLPDASAFINGNFFDTEGQILGLLVADSIPHGASYGEFAGMFQVQNGVPRVRSLRLEPYTGEALEQAVQGFPLLVENGQPAYTRAQSDDAARRTVIAQDSSGRILWMVTPYTGIRLTELSAYLPSTDMSLVTAVNLDGGGSTMLYIRIPNRTTLLLPSFDSVPAVLAAYKR